MFLQILYTQVQVDQVRLTPRRVRRGAGSPVNCRNALLGGGWKPPSGSREHTSALGEEEAAALSAVM